MLKLVKHSKIEEVIFPNFSTHDFSKDWSCLMESVEFIESLHYTTSITNNYISIMFVNDSMAKLISESITLNKKQSIYEAVSKFAKIYNNKNNVEYKYKLPSDEEIDKKKKQTINNGK